MAEMISFKINGQSVRIPEGKPVILKWKSKHRQRPGITTGVGWLKRGEKGKLLFVHQAFITYDGVESEYASSWTIYPSNIIECRLMRAFNVTG